jgi:sporulation protein YlmC with PRC-barrel domain
LLFFILFEILLYFATQFITLTSGQSVSPRAAPIWFSGAANNGATSIMEEIMSYTDTVQTPEIARKETSSLIAASKVKGTSVYNNAGDSLGSIYDVMLEKRSGKVTYAVMSFGGFLGIGEKYHPLPWHELTYSDQFGGYVVNLDRSVLEGAPAYDASATPDWSSPAYTDRIDAYYGNRPAL